MLKTRKELAEAAEAAGIPASGKSRDILGSALAAAGIDPTVEGTGLPVATASKADADRRGYDDLVKLGYSRLKALCEERGIPTNGLSSSGMAEQIIGHDANVAERAHLAARSHRAQVAAAEAAQPVVVPPDPRLDAEGRLTLTKTDLALIGAVLAPPEAVIIPGFSADLFNTQAVKLGNGDVLFSHKVDGHTYRHRIPFNEEAFSVRVLKHEPDSA